MSPENHFVPNQGESIEHIKTKLGIFNYIKSKWGDKLKEMEIEKLICNKTIRPDIYIETKKGNKIAIEVQASALTVSEIKRRTTKYFNEGIYVMWVLLFDYLRFYEFKKEWGTKDDGTWGLIDATYVFRDRVRLKEFEVFLYSAYYRDLIFWDIDQEHSQDFIVIKMSDYWTDDKEFRKDGEDYFYGGKQSKVTKTISFIKKDVTFDKFKPIKGRIFNGGNYDIPERTILGFATEPNETRRR
ncbi:MAG: competence protein CoiA family protein [Chryseolinea sp.]